MSMTCKCGAKAAIFDSRQDVPHRLTRRRYRCTAPGCGARWNTVEREVGETEEVGETVQTE